MIPATVVDSHALLQLLWTASAASLAVCICFGLSLRGLSNLSAARRAGRPAAAFAYAVAAVIPALICVAAIAAGVAVLISG